ncbi:MAG: AMP-binding protein [Paracoccaceae bacterium]
MTLDAVRLNDIHARVEKAAQAGRTFAITQTGQISFADVAAAAQSYGAGLALPALMPRKRMALTGDLGAGVIAALWLAGLRQGLTCLFVAPLSSANAAQAFCQDNQIDLIFMPNGPDGVTAYGPHGMQTLLTGHNTPHMAPETPSAVTVFFTSGSTGRAKGVHLGADGLARHLELYTRLFNYDRAGAVVLNGLPLHHTDGSFHGPMIALWSGATWLQPPPFTVQTAGHWAKLAQQHQASHLIANPTLLAMLLAAFPGEETLDFGPLAAIISSAEVLPSDLWQRCEDRFKADLVNIYGMSETTNGGFFALPSDRPRSFGTVGRAHDIAFEIRDDCGELAQAGVPGRLFLRGESLFQGYEQGGILVYQRRPEDWFDTADQAVLDGNGNLSILRRLDGKINLAGYLTSPAAIARAMTDLGIFSQVRVEVLDEDSARQVPVAFVPAPVPAACAGLIGNLPVEIRPRHIVPVPKVSVHDLSLAECATLFAQHRAAQGGPVAAAIGDVEQTVIALAARAFRCDPAQLDLHATQDATPGWDSFAFIELVLEAEMAFQTTFSVEDLSQINTLSNLVRICVHRTCVNA